jgi:hypothetical protein
MLKMTVNTLSLIFVKKNNVHWNLKSNKIRITIKAKFYKVKDQLIRKINKYSQNLNLLVNFYQLALSH